MEMTKRYPLQWPEGWTRTEREKRKHSRFTIGHAAAEYELELELRRLGATDAVLTTNMDTARMPQDPGVAVYFTYNKQASACACDQYLQLKDNMLSIAHSIKALRGIKRWGAAEMMARAVSGFKIKVSR